MELQGLFGETLPVLEKALDLRSVRHTLISSNIANIDTPNYRSFDLQFKEEMNRAVGSGKTIPLSKTDGAHLPATGSDESGLSSRLVDDSLELSSANGNGVNIDREMMKLSENNLMYNATAQIVSKKLQGLRTAINGSGR